MSRIVADTSALLAITQGEPEAEEFARILFKSKGAATISAANHLEALIVSAARDPESGERDLRSLIDVFEIAVDPVTEDMAELAFRAFMRFGKGRHPACLNYGDCFSYALAKRLGAPLLFTGGDFRQTDIGSVLDEDQR